MKYSVPEWAGKWMTLFCAEAFSLVICACLDSYTAPKTTLKLGGFQGTGLEQSFLRTWAHSGLFHHLQYGNQGSLVQNLSWVT